MVKRWKFIFQTKGSFKSSPKFMQIKKEKSNNKILKKCACLYKARTMTRIKEH
jgi:hypothetical protein